MCYDIHVNNQEKYVAIVDYQAGNLRSVQKALEKFGARSVITSDPEQIRSADAMIFPGQGANDSSMRHLRSSGLVDPIKEFVQNGKLFLGICLGLQLILEGSDEGIEPGLGLVDGWVRHLPAGHKIPHMGWNTVNFRIDHPIFSGVPENSYFY